MSEDMQEYLDNEMFYYQGLLLIVEDSKKRELSDDEVRDRMAELWIASRWEIDVDRRRV